MSNRYTRNYGQSHRTKGSRFGVLYFNAASGEGDVQINTEFDQLDPVTQIDIINDWMFLLNLELEAVQQDYETWRKGFEKKNVGNVVPFTRRIH